MTFTWSVCWMADLKQFRRQRSTHWMLYELATALDKETYKLLRNISYCTKVNMKFFNCPQSNCSLGSGDPSCKCFVACISHGWVKGQDWRRERRTETWGCKSMGEMRSGDSSSNLCFKYLQALPKAVASLPAVRNSAVWYLYCSH